MIKISDVWFWIIAVSPKTCPKTCHKTCFKTCPKTCLYFETSSLYFLSEITISWLRVFWNKYGRWLTQHSFYEIIYLNLQKNKRDECNTCHCKSNISEIAFLHVKSNFHFLN